MTKEKLKDKYKKCAEVCGTHCKNRCSAPAKLAFYVGKGNIADKLIRFWTKSKYSHVELIKDDYWLSTSPRLKKITKRKVTHNPENWEFVDIVVDENFVNYFYEKTKDKKYDWLGIFFSQLLPLNIQNPSRWFCSEWVAECIKIVNPGEGHKLSPGELYDLLKECCNYEEYEC